MAQEIRRTVDDDARIAARATARLRRHDSLVNVQVGVKSGVVTLTGTVASESQSSLATALMEAIEGIVEVQNSVQVEAPVQARFHEALDLSQMRLSRMLGALPLLLVAATVVLLFWWLGRWFSGRLHWLRLGSDNPYFHSVLRRIVQFLMFMVGVLVALELLNATALVGAVLGSAGVIGLMLGFAFRDLAENYLAGILLSLRRPFEPGDHLLVDGHEGRVMSLNSRATVLMTLDGNYLRLPNSFVFKAVMLNYTRNPLRRLQVVFGIGNDEDLLQAQRLGIQTLRGMPAIVDDPPPQALVASVGDSSVTMHFNAWMDQRQTDYMKVNSEAIRLLKKSLEEAGMDLPEPIYRVQLSGRDGLGGISLPGAEKSRLPAARSSGTSATRGSSDDAQQDVSVDDSLDQQIALERETTQTEDLLRHPAPKE
ncbi:MAG: mechanosensitive ion channel [Pseudomonadota bacterium]|nr:mechanosensitive ion channel [Pseudomonadota bacterium]